MLDVYHIGAHHRNSPEAAVPLINLNKIDNRAGGAANVAMNLAALGLEPFLFSVVGEDESARILSKVLLEAGVSFSFSSDANRPTTTKTRIVNESFQQYLRVDKESKAPIANELVAQFQGKIETLALQGEISALVIQDYNKGVVTLALIKVMQAISKRYELPLFVDPKYNSFVELSQCTLFKPNLNELSLQVGYKVKPLRSEIDEAIRTLGLYHMKMIIITLGENGIYYCDHQSQLKGLIPGIAVNNADVSGAGDSVLSALIYSYLKGNKIDEMATMANRAGSLICEKKGVSVLNNQEYLGFGS